MGQQLVLLVVGFALTGVAGGVLGVYLQNRAWDHQHDAGRRDNERSQALTTFEEISRLLDRRLYRMRQLHSAVRHQAAGTGDDAAIDQARDSYREIVTEWNDMLQLLQADTIGRAAPPAISAAAPPARLLLGIGHKGPAVSELQIALARGGEQVDPDGIFGPRTWDALRSFQKASGLNPDGIAGPLTTAALSSAGTSPKA